MAKQICMNCGKKEGLTDFNYAGFNVNKRGTYPFPERIKKLVLPGYGEKEFLCDSCANLLKIKCKVHGTIKDDFFGYGKPPRCKKCDAEFKSIKSGNLPKTFTWLVPLTEISMRRTNIKEEGFLVASANKTLHLITKDAQSSVIIKSFLLEVLNHNGNRATLVLNIPEGNVSSCRIDLQDSSIFTKSKGPWFDLWVEKIVGVSEMQRPNKFLWLASIELQTASKSEMSTICEKSPVAFCYIQEKTILAPHMNLWTKYYNLENIIK